MKPVQDPLHHVSFPEWLEGGFANLDFPVRYDGFVAAVAQRYPWVESWTPVNEPLPTTIFCSCTGLWYPHLRSDRDFVKMAMNVGRAACRRGPLFGGSARGLDIFTWTRARSIVHSTGARNRGWSCELTPVSFSSLAASVDFRGFCWYPSIDSTDWCHLCLKAANAVDPQGIWGLDASRWKRIGSELSYDLSEDTGGLLCGHAYKMRHWNTWRDQDERKAT